MSNHRFHVTRLALALAFALGIAVAGSSSVAPEQGDVSVSAAWVRLPAAGETTAAAFATFRNTSMYDMFLMSAATGVAAKVEFRDLSKPGDAAPQRVKQVTVPSYETLVMTPKTVQMVLIDLERPLVEGETVTLTLTTDGGANLRLEAVVKKEP